jgi:hypothetical protein
LKFRTLRSPASRPLSIPTIQNSSLIIPHSQRRLDRVFVKSSLAQQTRYTANRLDRTGPSSRCDHLYGQIPFTHCTISGPHRRMHDIFRATCSEQLFLQSGTPHRHADKSPFDPPSSKRNIVEVSQRFQPSNCGSYLCGESPLRREQSFDLGRRAIAAGQRAHRELQPPVGRRCRFVCNAPAHGLLQDRCLVCLVCLVFWLNETNQRNQINKTNQINLFRLPPCAAAAPRVSLRPSFRPSPARQRAFQAYAPAERPSRAACLQSHVPTADC